MEYWCSCFGNTELKRVNVAQNGADGSGHGGYMPGRAAASAAALLGGKLNWQRAAKHDTR